MDVNVADTDSCQVVLLDEMKNFRIRRSICLGQVLQIRQKCAAVPQIAERQFSNHEGMDQHSTGIEQPCDGLVANLQMINPDRRVD